jgi:Rad3-related DNA helicase
MRLMANGKRGEANANIFDFNKAEEEINEFVGGDDGLKTSESLDFLKEDNKKIESIFEQDYWSLYLNDNPLKPLVFTNKKSQSDVVKEIVENIKDGHKVIFLHGACGTGKSAIALNVARVLGRTSVVVPVKALQKQYGDDYTGKMSLLKNGKKMKIAMLTGRENHASLIEEGKSCADPFLPENIKLVEKNYKIIMDYYHANPLAKDREDIPLKDIRRTFIAPANPFWSPIIPASLDIKLGDAKKKKYQGCDKRDYVFYHRKKGCSYYDQYLAYFDADVIIFNSAKYLSELSLGRKPLTEVDIIDEADDFLDGLFEQSEVNLTRFYSSLKNISPESVKGQHGKEKVLELLDLEEKNKKALGVNPDKVIHIKETKIKEIFDLLNSNSELEAEIALEELNYANKALEAARNFKGSLDEVYVTFRKEDDNLIASFVSTNLSAKFQELTDKSKALVFMSGTLHSESVLKNIFKIKDYKIIEAETANFGHVEIIRTGKEFDCKYSNLKNRDNFRRKYLDALSSCLDKAIVPVLVHVHAYQDLPKEDEKMYFGITNVLSAEKLMMLQNEDKTGMQVSLFKKGLNDTLFSTKCSRGVDFPGNVCNSIVFTKYPNPNYAEPFWKVLQMKHPEFFWDFYRDKARREFLQRIYRALRSKDDHVYILSPDTRVLDAVREMQENGH